MHCDHGMTVTEALDDNTTTEAFHTMTAALTPHRRLILFGRYPVPGQTKTRLIPDLGPIGAADLQRRLTEKSLAAIMNGDRLPWPVTFCHAGGRPRQVRRWLGRYSIDFEPQAGGTLGARMQSAIYRALNGTDDHVVLVGTDIPRLSAVHLHKAFDALNRSDLVIGPSRDGGYWLIGMRRKAAVFDHIEWGTTRVFSQTMASADRLGLSTALLPELNDIDTAADLNDWQPHGLWRRPYLSIVIPTLNEAGSIEKTIEAAKTPDSEIIVADGGSSDGTVAVARSRGADVISAPTGRARQQNAGAESARGRVLLFLHADTRLPKGYGDQVFDSLLCPDTIAGAFRFKTDYDHPGMRLIEKMVYLRSTFLHMPYGDQALFVSEKTFTEMGGFPDVAIAEDLYLVKKLARRGHIRLAPGAAITSGRRWQAIGLWKTTIINWIIAAGALSGIDPGRLAPLYRRWLNTEEK